MSFTQHARERFAERVDPAVEPITVWLEGADLAPVLGALVFDRGFVTRKRFRYVARIPCVFVHDRGCVITVLVPRPAQAIAVHRAAMPVRRAA